jgi:CBS domain-containing protein
VRKQRTANILIEEETQMTTCNEVMTRNPVSCLLSDSVYQAATLMKGQNVGPIPVVESHETNRLVGIVTDRDLALKVIAEGRDPKSTRLESVMTRDPVACTAGDSLQKAFEAMEDHQVRRVPVVDDQKRLVGIISQADVATRIGAPRKTAEVVEKVSRPATGAV